MRPVRADDGTHYLLVKRSDEASLVRDPVTGNECYVRNDRLEAADETSALETAARAVPAPVRRLVRAVHDDRSLGLVVTLADRGPLTVRTLVDETTYCESDLAGVLASLTAADVITDTDVAGEPAYDVPTETADALSTLRTAVDPETDSR
ncbi:hypothetical protein C479_02706 [Halovivax asiaticus JCM 14624]|uniref:HTH marR-type domain-containing protein n=1 Tax=Halovivax asiaticus JCM 14624 TaxID=1227490 RepID=M0BS03_9EURY|nr:hypothetical protein [Halovivax asiaticus]ELZ13720.1 hypothetical protein C479_02706 [Halovivax asiaticus JCM 14624]